MFTICTFQGTLSNALMMLEKSNKMWTNISLKTIVFLDRVHENRQSLFDRALFDWALLPRYQDEIIAKYHLMKDMFKSLLKF